MKKVFLLLNSLLLVFLSVIFTISCKQDVDDEEKEHSFSEWVVELEPTCTSIGLKKRKCTGCGFEETETIPAKGHEWDNGEITTEATCVSAGVKTYTCSKCKEKKTEVIPAKGHSWDSGVVTKEPTCTEPGIRTYTCSVCKEIKMESIAATGHSFDGIECKNCHEYSVKLSEIGKTYTDVDGLNVTLNSFTYNNADGYNNYSINYTFRNNVPGSEKEPGIFKIIYKTSSGSLESSYQTGSVNMLYYQDILTRSYNWKLPNDKTFVCIEYIADSQKTSYMLDTKPTNELLNWIYIEISYDNIDKIPCSTVTHLQANYDRMSKKIIVTWNNPINDDFDCVYLSYTKGGISVVSNEKILNEIYSINDVEIDGAEYIFTLNTKYFDGKLGSSSTVNILPSEVPSVQSIELSRYHLAYDDPDQTITAVARISNAELIEDDTIIKIQTKDSNGNVTNTVATLNKKIGIATATITVPSSNSNSSSYGENYTVLCKIGTESANLIHTARFNVSSFARLRELSQLCINSSCNSTEKFQISVSEVTKSTTGRLIIYGFNLDLTTPSVQLYDSTGAAYFTSPIAIDTSSISWTASSGSNYEIIETVIPIPMVDDTYVVKVLFDDVAQSTVTRTLQVYDVPKFTSFSIPKVSVTKDGNMVTAKIVGKNFDTIDVDLGNFNATCPDNARIVDCANFTRVSDSILYTTFKIPSSVGEYTITVSYGSNSVNGILKVADYSSYNVGDILLNDGSIIAYDENILSFINNQKSKVVGVLYGFNEYDVPAGWLGLYNSAGRVNSGIWAPRESKGYNTYFTDIICTPSVGGIDAADKATFSGDTDGSDNWEYICSLDPVGSSKTSINYPAFNYVNSYANTYGLTGDYAQGWYMPSLAELCYIYRNKDFLNTVLNLQLSSEYYWTSSQDAEDIRMVWIVNFTDGGVYHTKKDDDVGSWRVCCVRTFE